jgi:hypothetical protein
MKVVLTTGDKKFLTHISRRSDEQSVTRKFEKMLLYLRSTDNGLSHLRNGLQRSLNKYKKRYCSSRTDENLNRLKTVLRYALKLNVYLIKENITPLSILPESGLATKQFLEDLFSTAQPGECIAYTLGNKSKLAVKLKSGIFENLTQISRAVFKFESVPFGVTHNPVSDLPKSTEVSSPLVGKKQVRFKDPVSPPSPVISFETTSAEFIRLTQHDQFTFLPSVNSKLALNALKGTPTIKYPVVGLSGDQDFPFIYFEDQTSTGVKQEGPESHLKDIRSPHPHSYPPAKTTTSSLPMPYQIGVELSAAELGTSRTFRYDDDLTGLAMKSKNGEIVVGQYFYDPQPAQVKINGLNINYQDLYLLCRHPIINFSVNRSEPLPTSFYTIFNGKFGEKYKFHGRTLFRACDLNKFLSRFRNLPRRDFMY